ncbi:hypothetical protein HID58_065260, partial [Brassica napus]
MSHPKLWDGTAYEIHRKTFLMCTIFNQTAKIVVTFYPSRQGLRIRNQVAIFQAQLMKCHRRLSCWKNIDSIENTEHLNLLEESLRKSIVRIQIHKEHYGKNQLLPIECTTTHALKKTSKKLDHDVNIHEFLGARNQTIKGRSNHLAMFQAQLMEFHRKLRPKLPLVMGGNNTMQEAHSMTWLPDNSNQQTILPGESSFLPNREMDGSLLVYSNCFFESVKQEDQKCNKPLSKYSYPTPFGTTLGMEEDHEKKIKTEMDLNNLQQQQDPSSMFDPTASSSSSCFQIPHDQPCLPLIIIIKIGFQNQCLGQTSYNQ